MEISVRGWGRNMGWKPFVRFGFDDLTVEPSDDHVVAMNEMKLHFDDGSIRVSWQSKNHLSGRHMFVMRIPNDEIVSLFKRIYGDIFSREQLNALGIVAKDAKPTRNEIHNAIFEMNIRDIISFFRELSYFDMEDNQISRSRNLLRKINEFEFSPRTINSLKNIDTMEYIGDLIQRTESELLHVPNFTRRCLNEVKEILANMGFHLGMKIPWWPTT